MVAVHVKPNIPLSRFAGFLHSLGFVTEQLDDRTRISQAEHDIVLTLPRLESNDIVPPHHIVAARRMLDERGVLDEQVFDQWLLAAMRTVAA